MSLSDLASLGSFVSGLAVVVTLIFLLLQMRQSNLNQRALMQQMRSARSIDTVLKHTDPFVSEVVERGFRNDLSLDDSRVRAFIEMQIANLLNWEDSYHQNRLGTLDTQNAEADVAVLRLVASMPAFRAAWRMVRNTFSTEYRAHVDTIMRETTVLREGLERSKQWRIYVAEESSPQST